MDKEESIWERYGIAFVLLACFVVGAFLVEVFSEQGRFPFKFGEHLAMATAIAGLIGLLIDTTLKRDFAKNVFKAAIGYLLPEEIRGELGWLYNQPFICKDHTQTIHIEPIKGTNLVTYRCEITRDFQNVTAGSQTITPGLGLEENFHKNHPSRITSCTYQVEGEPRSANFAKQLETDPLGTGIRVNTDKAFNPPVQIRPGARVRVSLEFEKTFYENDFDYSHFGAPTTKVTVIVYAPPEFMTNVVFSHRDSDPLATKTGPHTWILNAVLLPLQGIRVIWNRREAYEEWKKTYAPSEVSA